jgi:hypothetical protein
VTQAPSGVHDSDAERLADLRGGDADARSGVERVDQVERDSASEGIGRVDGVAGSFEHGVREKYDRSDRHA